MEWTEPQPKLEALDGAFRLFQSAVEDGAGAKAMLAVWSPEECGAHYLVGSGSPGVYMRQAAGEHERKAQIRWRELKALLARGHGRAARMLNRAAKAEDRDPDGTLELCVLKEPHTRACRLDTRE